MTDKTLAERQDEIYIQLSKIKDLAIELNSYVTEDLIHEGCTGDLVGHSSFRIALEDFIDLAKDIYGYSSVFADYIIGDHDDLPIDSAKDSAESLEEGVEIKEIKGILFKRLDYFRRALLIIYFHYSDARYKLYVPVSDGEIAETADSTLDTKVNETMSVLCDIVRLQTDILNFLRPRSDKEEANKKCK